MAWQASTNIPQGRRLAYPRVVVSMICGAAVALVLAAPRARADEWNKRTVLTVNQPLQVRDRVLEPGKYVFQLLDSQSNRFTVQIFNGDQTHIVDTVFAIPGYRLEPAPKTIFTFWETPPGTARALRDWYYPGDTIGREFPYPQHPKMLDASLNAPAPSPMKPPEAAAAPAPREAPATQNQPTEMAETPAPAAPAPQPQPAAEEPAPTPAALPKTASPYPTTGLAGVLLAGLYGLLRWRRAMYVR
ncbi:MAG: hypothetical protein ACLQPN_01520 [Bryobacteraceae bacterium]